MIIARAPVRISFVGGGTDLPLFYTSHTGRVISATIDKYVYVVLNRPPLLKQISARYAIVEQVDHPRALKNDRMREALLYFGIDRSVDLMNFSDVPVKTGLGSSSSFSVALMSALLAVKGKKMDAKGIAELAAHLEIDLVGDPIGKQDQYAAAVGGFNIFQFNNDHTVDVTPLRLDFKLKYDLENHLLVFFTGITRDAASILAEQKEKIPASVDVLKNMADSVTTFRDKLVAGDFETMGRMLHEGWLMKKTLAQTISNGLIDQMYEAGINAGAWGGKVLGAGGGGCMLFMAPNCKKDTIRTVLAKIAHEQGLTEFNEIPIRFSQSGAEILMNNQSNFA